jgi:hypothetical protein
LGKTEFEGRPAVSERQFTGVVRAGQVQFDTPLDLPDGTAVRVTPTPPPADAGVTPWSDRPPLPDIEFMTEEEQDGSPEEVARWIALERSLPGLPESAAKFFEPTDWDREVGRISAEAVHNSPDYELP